MLQALRMKISLTPYYSSSRGLAILLYESLLQKRIIKLNRFFANSLQKPHKTTKKMIFHFFAFFLIVRTFFRNFDLDKSIDRIRNLAHVIVRTLLCPEIK